MTAPPVNTLPAALAYAARSIKVVPLKSWREGGKIPAVEGGFTVATIDAEQINAWWSTRDEANVGIATGQPAGFWVVDVDGPEGEEALAALVAVHGALPATPEQTTARGRHICFAYDPARPIRNSAGKIGKKIDVRGDGGYIVAAPSKHPDGPIYTWHPERRPSKMAFAQAPEWLIALAEKKPEPAPRPAPNSSPQAGPRPDRAPAKPSAKLISPWAETILREECEKIASAVDGTVNETLNRCSFNVGCVVGGGELDEDIARIKLIASGMAVCKPPWTIVQVSEHVERAMQQGMLKPRYRREGNQPRPPHMQPAPVREARTVDQAQPAEATVVDIRQPDRGYTPDTAWGRDIIRNEDGKIVPRMTNAILFLMNHRDVAGTLAFDTFASSVAVVKRPPWELEDGTDWQPRALSDNDVTWAVAWLESKGLAMKPQAIHSACIAAAQRNSFNPAIDWLCAQQWDQQERLSTWLTYYLGADDTPYVRAIGRKWLIGAVARIMRPGCKMDAMLIWEGPQGIGKSKAARIMGTFGDRSYFTDEISDIGSKDAAMQLQGVAIVEIAELNALDRSDVNAIKAWLTRTTDRYRPPYGRMVVEAPRQCVLIGTVNPDGAGYLQDATGARRFWPVTVTGCNHDDLQAVQPQLWAEAVAAFRAGETWWLDDEEQISSASTEQGDRYADDPWGVKIDKFVELVASVSAEEIMSGGCLNLPADRQNTGASRRIARHLKRRGWSQRRVREGKAFVRRYFRPEGE